MKHILFILFSLMGTYVSAQEFLPVLTEGKVWHYRDSLASKNRDFTLEVRGDTVDNGRNCKKLYYESGSCTTRYEEDGRLFCFEPENEYSDVFDTPCLICDFNLEVGDAAWKGQVMRVDTIEVRGVQRKRIVVSDVCPQVIWVEGIGSYTNEWPSVLPMPTNGHVMTFITECYENGELIFTKDDFFAPAVSTGIGTVTIEKKDEGRIYDLTGRPVSRFPVKGIYIQNGKKLVK